MKKRTHLFYSQLGLTLMASAFLVIPVIQSVLAGVTTNFIFGLKSGLTLRWIVEVWNLYSDTIFRSILIGLTCLAVDLAAGVHPESIENSVEYLMDGIIEFREQDQRNSLRLKGFRHNILSRDWVDYRHDDTNMELVGSFQEERII